MKMRGEVLAVAPDDLNRWSGRPLYKVTVAATDDNDSRVSEIQVEQRLARSLSVGRRVVLELKLKAEPTDRSSQRRRRRDRRAR